MSAINSIERAQAALRYRREAGNLPKQQNPREKHEADPKSRAKAISAKCFDCQGEDADANWKWRIGNCEIPSCPLWAVRPYQRLQGRPVPAGLR